MVKGKESNGLEYILKNKETVDGILKSLGITPEQVLLLTDITSYFNKFDMHIGRIYSKHIFGEENEGINEIPLSVNYNLENVDIKEVYANLKKDFNILLEKTNLSLEKIPEYLDFRFYQDKDHSINVTLYFKNYPHTKKSK